MTVDIPSGCTHLGCVIQQFEAETKGSEEVPGERTSASDFEEFLSVDRSEHLFGLSLHDGVPLSGYGLYVLMTLLTIAGFV